MAILKLLKEWYTVGASYGGAIALPLFIWTVCSLILLATVAVYFMRTGRVPALFSRRWGFVIGLSVPWAAHSFILYLSFLQIDGFVRGWGGHFQKPSDFTLEILTVHRAAAGMSLTSTLCLVLATCLLLRGVSR